MNRPALRLRTGRRPCLWGALLGLLLLLGTMEVHPAGKQHALGERLRASEYAPEAAHPGQPIHLEPGAVVSQPHCPVCLQRLQLGGLHLAPATGLMPPAGLDFLPAPGDLAFARGIYSPAGARAPPLS